MKIKIIQIGKNGKLASVLIDEYVKRIKPYASVEIVTLKEIPSSKTFSERRCIDDEGKEILNALRDDEYIVVLDEKGQQFRSVEFAEFLRENKDIGRTVTFVIGGPYGLSKEVKERSNLLMSLSKMTFTYQMTRIIILEQVYRGLSIMLGKGYHND
ncbi:23S rRNA (pseudouridine(1915)-N(3))-methyltransferase RlmH [Candidatus Peregrinibacteria bacterium]|nr:23S rRNA (pseudouridine(1915)-N(3))-methyltransferase RlmH [Candidatus Peregrinibacteria bacterium]